jgi:hypothetical protein
MKRRLPKGLRKYIRQEKARIRREVLDIKEQEKLIQELNQKLSLPQRAKVKKRTSSSSPFKKDENRRNLQLSNK